MAGVANTDLADLIADTLVSYPLVPDWSVLWQYQRYEAIDNWLAKQKTMVPSGRDLTWHVQAKEGGHAAQVQLYQKDDLSVSDLMTTASAPWTYHRTYWNIERHEILQNRKPARLVELLKSRRIGAMQDSADMLEALAWSTPTTTTDVLNPRGVFYYLVPCLAAGTVQGAFQGGHPYDQASTQHSTCAGISTTTYPRWRSYNAMDDSTDGSVSEKYLERMRRAFHALQWRSPVINKDLENAPFNKLRIYTCLDKLVQFESKVRAQNDQLGADVGKFAGATVFKNIPIVYVPYLDTYDDTADASNYYTGQYPLLFINHNFFKAAVLEGDYFRESEPIISREQHNVFTTFVDLTYQFICTDRQKAGAVIAYSAV